MFLPIISCNSEENYSISSEKWNQNTLQYIKYNCSEETNNAKVRPPLRINNQVFENSTAYINFLLKKRDTYFEIIDSLIGKHTNIKIYEVFSDDYRVLLQIDKKNNYILKTSNDRVYIEAIDISDKLFMKYKEEKPCVDRVKSVVRNVTILTLIENNGIEIQFVSLN